MTNFKCLHQTTINVFVSNVFAIRKLESCRIMMVMMMMMMNRLAMVSTISLMLNDCHLIMVFTNLAPI